MSQKAQKEQLMNEKANQNYNQGNVIHPPKNKKPANKSKAKQNSANAHQANG